MLITQMPQADISIDRALSVLEHYDKEWLLLVDGADDSRVLAGLLPPGHQGNVLYTSRNGTLRPLPSSQTCHIHELGEDEAIQLLLSTAHLDGLLGPHEDAPALIVRELGCLALAVAQAGAYIKMGESSIHNFLAVFRKRRQDLLSNEAYKGASDYDRAVYATWDMSYDALARLNGEGARAALQILNIVAFFHHDNIDVEIFQRAAESIRRPPPSFHPQDPKEVYEYCRELPLDILTLDSDKEWDDRVFRKGLRTLLELSLVTEDGSGASFGMHVLVHGWAYDRQTARDRETHFALAQSILAASVRENTSETYYFYKILLPHVAACEAREATPTNADVRSREKAAFGLVFDDAGQFEQTERVEVQAFEAAKRELGEEHRHTLWRMSNLAQTYLWLGRMEKAEEMAERALKIGRKTLGEENPYTLHFMRSRVTVYIAREQWTEAEELLVRTRDLSRKVLGKEHPDTLKCTFYLAHSYYERNRWEEAEELLVGLSEVGKRTLGEKHPNRLVFMRYLAWTYKGQGRLSEAVELMEETVALRFKVLGADHPNTVNGMEDLEDWRLELEDEEVEELDKAD